jgi:hypothetical protein
VRRCWRRRRKARRETIGEATAAKEGGEAAFWHRQIENAGKIERDRRKKAGKIVERYGRRRSTAAPA